MSDNQYFFNGLKQGDHAIVSEIYKLLLPKVTSWILANGGDKEQARDVFQEVLETIILKIETVEKSFDGLVFQMAKFKFYDQIRKAKRTVRNQDEIRPTNEESSIEDQIIEAETSYIKHKLIERAFKELSNLCQDLLTLIKEGKKVEHIKTQLNFNNNNTIYRRKAACIERWSTLIKNDPAFKDFKI